MRTRVILRGPTSFGPRVPLRNLPLRGLAYTTVDGGTTDFNTIQPFPPAVEPILPICGQVMPGGAMTNRMCQPQISPDDVTPPPGVALAVPGLSPGGVVPANTAPAVGQTPTIVATPASGPIPPPSTVAAATAPSGIMAWLKGTMFLGIPNWVLLAGAGALLLSGGKK